MDRIELQVEVLEVLKVSKLLHANFIISQVESCQILEIAQVLLNHVHDLFGRQFGLDSLMRQPNSARKQNKETVEEQTQALRHLADGALVLHLLQVCSVVFTPFEALLGLHRVNDVRDYCSAHRHRHALILAHGPALFAVCGATSVHLLGRSVLPVTDNLSADLLLAREVFHTARIQRVSHLVHQRAMTVTFTVFWRDVILLILLQLLLRLDSIITLRTDMVRLDHTQLLLHLVTLLGDKFGSDQLVSAARVGVLEAV